MKTPIRFITNLLALFALSTLDPHLSTAHAQGTAFSYQGRLNDGANAARGYYDLTFSLFNVSGGGSAVAGPLVTNAVAVSNGLFTVALDFGAGVFNGTGYWLEIGVRTNGGGAFATLNPRQPLTPSPYAIYAGGVTATGISGTVPAASIGGTYGNTVNFNNGADSFDGSFFGQFFGSTFTGGIFTGAFVGTGSGLGDVWHTGGNSGTTAGVNFLGTTDNQPLEMHVDGVRALRLEPTANAGFVTNAVNVIAGSPANVAGPGVVGATIAGGGAPYYFGGGTANRVLDNFGTIGGGVGNDIETNAYESTIAGGNANSILPGAFRSTIAGGWYNQIETNASHASIGGGFNNTILGSYDAIGGGHYNVTGNTNYDAPEATVAGGAANTASGISSFIGGGAYNLAYNNNAVVAGGLQNRAGFHSAVVSGYNNSADGAEAMIGGGRLNSVNTNSTEATVGGGYFNTIQGNNYEGGATIGGGGVNTIQPSAVFDGNNPFGASSFSTIGGGYANTDAGAYATIPGGLQNVAGPNSFAAGSYASALNSGSFVWSDSSSNNVFATTGSNQFLIRASGGVGIGTNNPSAALHVVGTSSTNMALRISNGGIAVSGAGIGTGTPAFVHQATGANIQPIPYSHLTLINNPLCNGDPKAILLITPNWNAGGGVYDNHPTGVFYNTPTLQWGIFNQDLAPMPTNACFNVLVIKP